MQAPFPYFGGKTAVAAAIWGLLGDVDHYMEPFFGSGAVLLNRPDWTEGKTETVCDKDGHVANVWRAIILHPEETAKWCDWPVNHADLMARKKCLIENESRLLDGLIEDPKWCDAELAGYWIWAASCWIGSGLTDPGKKMQRPHLAHDGMGVHKTKRPDIGSKGKGVHKTQRSDIGEWFNALSVRLRRVRVVCGDFMRILGGDWQHKNWKTVGLFFDPPYGDTDRDDRIYAQDGFDIAERVEAWCLERGSRENFRIVIAGYDTEYEKLISAGWTAKAWKAQGGYGNLGNGRGKENRYRETLFISPHCMLSHSKKGQMSLF